METAGKKLRLLREQLGFSLRDVGRESAQIAAKKANGAFAIPVSCLAYAETRGLILSTHRLYSLAIIYRYEFGKILSWYGIGPDEGASDFGVAAPPKSHALKKVGR